MIDWNSLKLIKADKDRLDRIVVEKYPKTLLCNYIPKMANSDLQSVPVDHLGICPTYVLRVMCYVS